MCIKICNKTKALTLQVDKKYIAKKTRVLFLSARCMGLVRVVEVTEVWCEHITALLLINTLPRNQQYIV